MKEKIKKILLIVLVLSLFILAISSAFFGYKNYQLNKMQTKLEVLNLFENTSYSTQQKLVETINKDKMKEFLNDIFDLFK